MAVYLYRPPTWRNVAIIEGSLRYGVPTSTCVYRQGGVWHNIQDAGIDQPVVADCDVWVDPDPDLSLNRPAPTLRLFFTKPMVVPGELHDELAANAITPADPSWTPGSLTLL